MYVPSSASWTSNSLRLLVRVFSLADVAWASNWTLVHPRAFRNATDRVEQSPGAERFFQVARCAGFLDPRTDRRVVVSRDEDDGHRQPLLKLEAAGSRHVDVED